MEVNFPSSEERKLWLSKSVEKNEAAKFFFTDLDNQNFRSELQGKFTLNFIISSSGARVYKVNTLTEIYSNFIDSLISKIFDTG